MSLSNRRRWGSQVTRVLPMQVNGAFHGIEKTREIKVYNISVYGIDFSSDDANKAMIKKKQPQTLDQRPGPRIVVGNIRTTRFGLIWVKHVKHVKHV